VLRCQLGLTLHSSKRVSRVASHALAALSVDGEHHLGGAGTPLARASLSAATGRRRSSAVEVSRSTCREIELACLWFHGPVDQPGLRKRTAVAFGVGPGVNA
jgi:hypothetical protein